MADQRRDPSSVLHLHRRLLALRKSSAALNSGEQHLLTAPAMVPAREPRSPARSDPTKLW
jgi:glycosidase